MIETHIRSTVPMVSLERVSYSFIASRLATQKSRPPAVTQRCNPFERKVALQSLFTIKFDLCMFDCRQKHTLTLASLSVQITTKCFSNSSLVSREFPAERKDYH